MLRAERLHSLRGHAARLRQMPLRDLCADAQRSRDWSLDVGPLHFNYARQRVDAAALTELLALAREAEVAMAIRRQFDGAVVNASEQRAALHTALRSNVGTGATAITARRDALTARAQMSVLAEQLWASDITDLIHVGIGGSDLGPRLVIDALGSSKDRIRVHFIANIDAHDATRVFDGLARAGVDRARCAGLLVSKSFGTRETLENGRLLRDWLGDASRLYAVSARPDRVSDFGIDADRVLPMAEWVGGRFSLWSAVGFSTLLALGEARFDQLLAGAALMDRHVRDAEPERNMALLHALLFLWNRNAIGEPTYGVIGYDQRLARLPAWLQQLWMESLGKSVSASGQVLDYATMPVIWGGVGTTVQHSFFQALHQGSDRVPLEFVGVCEPDHAHVSQHRSLLANLLAQAEALANGHASDDPRLRHPGGSPSSVLLLDRLSPEALGALLALYEHSTAILGHLWGVNAFDQPGVELGKQLADRLEPLLGGDVDADSDDVVTSALLARINGL